jgi:hypothetical protein
LFLLINTEDDDNVIAGFDTEAELMEYFSSELFSFVDDVIYVDILEYWAVSDILADRLEMKGEAVLREFGLNIWGRATSGQAIKLDGIIQEIAKDCYRD